MKKVLEEALRSIESGRKAALVILTRKKGSASRKPGAMMLVYEDGSSVDTIGGGILEEKLKKEAVSAIKEGKARYLSFTMKENSPDNLNLYCGGEVEFAIIPVLPEDKLYIFGGGHVSRALVRVLAPLGFRITVIDDREDFAKPENFPGASDVIYSDYREFAEKLQTDDRTYVVIATEDHEHDYAALTTLLYKPVKYLGMLGSRKKLETFKKRMNEKELELLEKLKSPVGLDIGAETPEEIAISIAAELVKTRRKGDGD